MAGTITMVSKVRDGVKTHGAAQLVITRKVIALRPHCPGVANSLRFPCLTLMREPPVKLPRARKRPEQNMLFLCM